MFRSFQIIIREFCRSLLKSLHITHLANYTLYNRFLHNMICCHKFLVYKNELNREYVITLARNDKTP